MTDYPEHYTKARVNWGVLIPALGIIGTIMAQTAVITWKMSAMNSGITENSRHVDRVEKNQTRNFMDINSRVTQNEHAANIQAIQLGRIDENVKSVKGILTNIQTRLERGK